MYLISILNMRKKTLLITLVLFLVWTLRTVIWVDCVSALMNSLNNPTIIAGMAMNTGKYFTL